MCIIIAKPQDVILKPEVFTNACDRNPDGAGFSTIGDDGRIEIHKGFFSLVEFTEAFKPHQAKRAVIHFRIATVGAKTRDNCHPYWVRNHEVSVAHNGTFSEFQKFSGVGAKTKNTEDEDSRSDTLQFVDRYLTCVKRRPTLLKDESFQHVLTSLAKPSKLVFLSRYGLFVANPEAGTEVDATEVATDAPEGASVWFSNESYKPRPAVTKGTGYYQPQQWNNWQSRNQVTDVDRETWGQILWLNDLELL